MSEGVKRFIRLKEFGASIQRTLEPSPEYLAATNGSLSGGPRDLRTDENGFIAGPESSAPEATMVAVLGDSFVECSFLAQGCRLTDRMSAVASSRGQKVFLNGGYSGSTSLNLLTLAIAKVPPVANEIILVVPSNDVLSLDNAGGYWAAEDKRYSPIVPYRKAPLSRGEFSANLWQLGAVLRGLESFCRAADIRLTLATFPHVRDDYRQYAWWKKRYAEPGAYEDLIHRRCRLNNDVRRLAGQLRVPLIDLEQICTPDYMYDDLHLNPEGASLLSDRIIDQMRSL